MSLGTVVRIGSTTLNQWLIKYLILFTLLIVSFLPQDTASAPESLDVKSIYYKPALHDHPVPLTKEEHEYPSTPQQLCNCWQFLKDAYYPDLPSMQTLIASASDAYGDIAVFFYPKSGVYHFAKTTGMGYGYFTIDEANYNRCERGERKISFDDPNLIGFVVHK